MSDSSKRKRPLVADQRRTSKSAASAKKTVSSRKSKTTSAKRGGGRGTPPRRKGLIGLLSALVRWVLRLIWTITWRITAVAVLMLALAVGYFYTTLPPLEVLLGVGTNSAES